MNPTLHPSARVTQASSPLVRFGWAIADAWIITRRDLTHWQRQPATVIMGWFFPVMIVLMFGLLFGGAIRVPNGGSYFEFLMPGMFATTMLFGLEATMIAVTTDASKGVTDRFRSLPMSASAVVLGRCIADMLNSLGGLTIMIGVGLLLGWHWHAGMATALAAIGLLLLLRFALLWVGIFFGLQARGPESVTSVQILVWPISFLSNAFVDPSTMPPWLGTIAQWNPLTATTSAIRQLFMNPGWQAGSWSSEHAVLLAIVWPILLAAIFLPLSVRAYRRLNR
ncbi:MAG TPA: ABC transporter permease [Ktedonobacteraceae bacterium]|jgi:ABC-2 type transport system permease protein|nr:ABC transporter permease [Ktedonobacteraceae bacterium]